MDRIVQWINDLDLSGLELDPVTASPKERKPSRVVSFERILQTLSALASTENSFVIELIRYAFAERNVFLARRSLTTAVPDDELVTLLAISGNLFKASTSQNAVSTSQLQTIGHLSEFHARVLKQLFTRQDLKLIAMYIDAFDLGKNRESIEAFGSLVDSIIRSDPGNPLRNLYTHIKLFEALLMHNDMQRIAVLSARVLLDIKLNIDEAPESGTVSLNEIVKRMAKKKNDPRSGLAILFTLFYHSISIEYLRLPPCCNVVILMLYH